MLLINRFLNIPEQSFFLLGPRGTGKSTWLEAAMPDALRIDLLDPATLRTYLTHPEYLESVLLGASQKKIVIDEIQKVPEILSVVHRLIEMKKGWQFILTGSSARKLKRTGVDLLAGRALMRHMYPFMAAELGAQFNLENALQYGLLPGAFDNPAPVDFLRAYLALYLKEEVQTEGLVRNIGHFARFLEAASFSHAGILNVSNIARECQVSRATVEGYLSILEDLLLSFQLPIFSRRAKRELISHQKFYYFDTGVYHFLRAKGPMDIATEIQGAALEGLVATHLRAWNDYQGSPYVISYWRTRSGLEVDFVVYGDNIFYALEVKNNTKVHSEDLRGLREFKLDYPESTPLFLYRGRDRLKIAGIDCIPVDAFLKSLTPKLTVISV